MSAAPRERLGLLHCTRCWHEWDPQIQLPMEMRRFARLLGSLRCVKCAALSRWIVLGPTPAEHRSNVPRGTPRTRRITIDD